MPTGDYWYGDVYGGNGFGGVTDGGENELGERQPFNTEPFAIPGRIPAAEFDQGGEGVAYHETSERASWAVSNYRADTPVDIKASPDDSSEYAIGRFVTAEWLTYSVTVEPGTYELRARVGTARNGRQLAVELGETQLATLDVPNQGGWGTYTTVSTEVTIEGEAGERILRLSPTQDGVDVAWVEFVPVEPDPEPDPVPATTIQVGIGGSTETITVFGASPADVSVAEGTVPDPTVMLGALPTPEDLE